MFTICLNKTFRPFGVADAEDISRPYPSGIEANVQLNVSSLPSTVRIVCRIETAHDVFRLLFATHAARGLGAQDISVYIPFLPYARQDRACNIGEAFSLKVLASILNAQNYSRVEIFDPHSSVSTALIDNAVAITNHEFVRRVLCDKENYRIVSPDAGASTKVSKVAEAIGYTHRIIQCLKHRNKAGNIDEVEIFETDFHGVDLYIVDDLCDGGATFTNLAKELKQRNAGKVYLIVSHGIFSKGLSVLKENGIDHIFTTDSFKDQEASDCLTEVKLCSIHT